MKNRINLTNLAGVRTLDASELNSTLGGGPSIWTIAKYVRKYGCLGVRLLWPSVAKKWWYKVIC